MDAFATARLRATRLADEHVADLVALHQDPEVARFIGGVRSSESTAEFVALNVAHWDRWGIGLWVLHQHDGRFVGRAGLRFVEVNERQELEVAYTLARVAWGCGFATEVGERLVRIWLQELTTPTLIGLVEPENAASAHVLEKLGLSRETRVVWRGAEADLFRGFR